jgi:hypothetical protein
MNRRQFLQYGWRQFGKLLPELTGPMLVLTPKDLNLGEDQSQPPSCFPDPPGEEGITNPSGYQAD